MEAKIEIKNKRIENRELIADLVVQSSQLELKPVPNYLVPNLIDEIPILSVVAAFSDGYLKLDGIGELRVKESNRLDAIQKILNTLGVQYDQQNDSLENTGAGKISLLMEVLLTLLEITESRCVLQFHLLGVQVMFTSMI